jgi:hypothetical protein
LQLIPELLTLILEPLLLIAQLASLGERPLVDLGRRARDLAGRCLHHKRRWRGSRDDGNFLDGDDGSYLHEIGD